LSDNVLLSKKKSAAKKNSNVDRRLSARRSCNVRGNGRQLQQMLRRLPLDKRSRREDLRWRKLRRPEPRHQQFDRNQVAISPMQCSRRKRYLLFQLHALKWHNRSLREW
jgi:hypothetical protein